MALEFQILDKSIDRTNFDCGVPELNMFLEKQTRQQQTKRLNRTFVLVDSNDSPLRILGYYSMTMGEIKLDLLPDDIKKKLPKHPVPVARIGRLAVDGTTKCKGYGKMLVVDAMKRVQRASLRIGVYAVVVDAKNDQAKNFYKKYGFIQFKDLEVSLFIPLASMPS